MNRLLLLGINHKTAPVEVREKLSFTAHEIINANNELLKQPNVREGLILSTCNRVEIYAVINGQNKGYIEQIKLFLSKFHNINILDFQQNLYVYQGEEVVNHLFRVASGLDSMVIGEVEILGQVKQAYQKAKDSKTTGKVLNRLLQKAFNTAKKVRSQTYITCGSVSVGSVAVKLSQQILGDLKDKKILIIGAGEVAEQLLFYLKKNGISSMLVANRTLEKAQALALRFKALAVGFENFQEKLKDVDIVIASTGAPHFIIRREEVLELMPKRKQRPLFIIDLAVPRDVEEAVNKIDNVYLYDIDDLQGIVEKNISLRINELSKCDKIIDAACIRLKDWMLAENKRHEA